jgi:steroid 5-alpha reductase family enzyme
VLVALIVTVALIRNHGDAHAPLLRTTLLAVAIFAWAARVAPAAARRAAPRPLADARRNALRSSLNATDGAAEFG